jgi:branched-chain amino acid transport system permease protein
LFTREDGVDAHALHRRGWSISAIARHPGHDRKTVRGPQPVSATTASRGPALLALSFNLLFGYTGLISFAHAAFFAIGGYSIGLALEGGLSWPLALLLASASGAVVGLLFSGFALRASGIYFAVLTLGLGEIIHIIALQWTPVTGGENGFAGISAGTWLGLNLDDPVVYYWVLVVVAVLAAAALRLVTFSRFGRTLTAIREDEVRAAYLGVPVRRYQAASFTTSAGFASLAGALSRRSWG